jgi:hypothetical protein
MGGSKRFTRLVLGGSLAGCLLAPWAAVATAAVGVSQVRQQTAPKLSTAGVREHWGVDILGIHLSAAGYILDFRYQVVDPAKACRLVDRSVRPILIDEASGHTLIVPSPPKVGSLRSVGDPKQGRNYFVLFGNPGKLVTRGGHVTVIIGDLLIPGVEVE